MPEHYNAGDRMPEGVLLLDSATGLPIPASALGGVTLAELLASVLPVAPNVTRGGGALDANTQRVTLATDGPGVASLSSIDNKTPALVSGAVPTTDSLGGTRQHNTAGGIRQAVGVGSARVALPTLSASREMYVMATQRCFFQTGDSSVTAVNTTDLTNMSHPLAADERFYFRVPSGHTHIAYIRYSADGFITIMPVA